MSENTRKMLVGIHSIKSALGSKANKLESILVSNNSVNKYSELLNALPKQKIQVVDKKLLDSKTNQPHQGIIAYFKLSAKPTTLKQVMNETDLVVLLDQVTDPHNVGAIVRSANAFGAGAVITTSKNAATDSPIIAKSSSGAIEDTPLIEVTNLSKAIEQLQKEGFWVVGLDGYAKSELSQVDLKGKIAFVMGSEGSGMRDLVKKNCDILSKLPMVGSVESLNVSVACGVSLYEYKRQN
ncbi:MAG TPA: 23S rRNA (guanosine(2251)-2'-O)-methyltransferase RlmB [Alphaproteobacteria bacterium]|nr:23S rRNA (guanosine(2251)-2'-O)-methyltransferase RlmB [Alphaproteobacteria bacterium]